jgi:hypothetical protein
MTDVMKKTFKRHSYVTLNFNPTDNGEMENFIWQFVMSNKEGQTQFQ